ncbi:MAG: MATE family efflux transporter [Polyangiaceae bacterium]|nr:MATE family efflux transporter [Polyangiaceae bacterium]MCW5792548.1 MATE family efflux transporter [Polyangiaceae bacterium]
MPPSSNECSSPTAAPSELDVHKIDTSKNPYGLVLKIAAPTVIAMLSQSFVNETNNYFFGWLPEPERSTAQAALFPSLILLWLFGGSLSAISVGTQAIAARRFAEGNTRASGAVLVNSWLFSLVASVIATALAYLSTPWILEVSLSNPEVRAAAQGFLNYRLLGIASMVITFSFKAFFDGLGKTHIHLVSAIIMNAINVVVCWLLIFGKFGFPRMGIEGAGLADALCTWIGLAVMVGWAMKGSYRKVFKPFDVRERSKQVVWAILRLSIPSAIATIAVMMGFFLFSVIVSKLDQNAGGTSHNLAATSVIVSILKLTFTACLAFGTATATLVSQSMGERKPDQAERFGWVSVRLGLIIFGVVGFLEGVVFPREAVMFFNDNPDVLAVAIGPMRMMGIITPMIAVGMILTQALFGAGESVFVMVVELFLHFLCLVPIAWVLGITLDFGLMGIWSAAVIYVFLLTVVMAWYFKRGTWKARSI